MMQKIAFAFAVLFLLASCEKREIKRVKYIATEAVSPYTLTYKNADGVMTTETVTTFSAQDQWKYTFMAEQGDILYVSGRYFDAGSALKVMILIDGKVYKQASSRGDTVRFVTVSGVLPY
jgi:hypothetical protein